MEVISKLIVLLIIIKQTISVQKLNFFMDHGDTLEIKYDLLLDKEQEINDLETVPEGPIIIHKPTEPIEQTYTNIQSSHKSYTIENILDVKNQEHNLFYLYK